MGLSIHGNQEIPSENLQTNEKYGIYKDECEEWLKKYEAEKT